MFFKCKVCEEKDRRIADLKEMLEKQTSLVNSLTNPTYNNAVTSELNTILDGASRTAVEIPVVTEERKREMSAVERQAIEMLTGLY